jgi:hypothetical protein
MIWKKWMNVVWGEMDKRSRIINSPASFSTAARLARYLECV